MSIDRYPRLPEVGRDTFARKPRDDKSLDSLSLSRASVYPELPSDLDRIRFHSFPFFFFCELGLESDYAAVINIVEDYNFEI